MNKEDLGYLLFILILAEVLLFAYAMELSVPQRTSYPHYEVLIDDCIVGEVQQKDCWVHVNFVLSKGNYEIKEVKT